MPDFPTSVPCRICRRGFLIVTSSFIYCSYCGAKFKLPIIPREITLTHKTRFEIGDSTSIIETPVTINTLELSFGDKFCWILIHINLCIISFQTYHAIWYIMFEHTIWYGIFVMAVIIERDGIRYRRTSVEVREDLHEWAKDKGVNMAAMLNRALEEKRGRKWEPNGNSKTNSQRLRWSCYIIDSMI